MDAFQIQLLEVERRLNLLDWELGRLEDRVNLAKDKTLWMNDLIGLAAAGSLCTGVLTVTVDARDGASTSPLSGVTVRVENADQLFTATTNGSGVATFSSVNAVSYQVSATAGGYYSSSTTITPVCNSTTSVTLFLDIVVPACDGCTGVVPDTLTVTDSVYGNCTLTRVAFSNPAVWYGCKGITSTFPCGVAVNTVLVYEYKCLSGSSSLSVYAQLGTVGTNCVGAFATTWHPAAAACGSFSSTALPNTLLSGSGSSAGQICNGNLVFTVVYGVGSTFAGDRPSDAIYGFAGGGTTVTYSVS